VRNRDEDIIKTKGAYPWYLGIVLQTEDVNPSHDKSEVRDEEVRFLFVKQLKLPSYYTFLLFVVYKDSDQENDDKFVKIQECVVPKFEAQRQPSFQGHVTTSLSTEPDAVWKQVFKRKRDVDGGDDGEAPKNKKHKTHLQYQSVRPKTSNSSAIPRPDKGFERVEQVVHVDSIADYGKLSSGVTKSGKIAINVLKCLHQNPRVRWWAKGAKFEDVVTPAISDKFAQT
jgi:hypothetical protein